MIKKTVVIIAVIVVMISCSNKDSYLLSGNLENCSECDLYLMEMENTGVKTLDTIHANSEGKFKVKERLEEESIFILQGPNDYIMLCPKISENIVINADYENLATTYSITGSEESAKLKLLNDKQVMTRFALKNMYEQLQSGEYENIDSVRHALSLRFRELRENQRDFLISYINSNEGSLTTLVALYRVIEGVLIINPITHADVWQKALDGLTKKYPNSKHTKFLREDLLRLNAENNNNNLTANGKE